MAAASAADGPVRLLTADEPPAASLREPAGASPFLVVCDHASRRIPRALGSLGLTEAQLSSHIGWDIGAAAVAGLLASALDASLAMQNYSRLVIDCNRAPGTAGSIPLLSDSVRIARNAGLDAAETQARVSEIFDRYHDAVGAILDRRQARQRDTVLVSVHSFTPRLDGTSRPWQIGVMYRHDARLAHALLPLLRQEYPQVGDNEPYALDDTDYTIPWHGERRGLPHVALELRQDLIADRPAQLHWSRRLAALLALAATHVLSHRHD